MSHYLQDFNIKRLPKEIQVNYLTQLSIDELVYFYNVDTGYRNLLNNKYVIDQIAITNDVNLDKPLLTFKELITRILWKLTPLEIYDLYVTNENLLPYMNDLRIISKYLAYLITRIMSAPTKIYEIFNELSTLLRKPGCLKKLQDPSLRGLIKIIDDAYKVEPKVNIMQLTFYDKKDISITVGSLTQACTFNIDNKSTWTLRIPIMLNILEKWGFDPNDYSHLSQDQLQKEINLIAKEIYYSQ